MEEIDDEKIAEAIKVNLTPLQENIIDLLFNENCPIEATIEDMAIILGVPELHVAYAMAALKGMGLADDE